MSRKRSRTDTNDDEDSDDDVAYTSAAHMLFAQPSDAVGRPIKLTKSEIQIEDATLDVMRKLTVPAISPATGPLLIPVATVDDDNAELVFDRPGVPLCSRGADCIAHMIDGPPAKPLNAYRGVGHDPDVDECLLCIRHHLGMMVQMHRTHGSKPPVGVMPPFCNLVDVPGGYHSAFCGVTPENVDVVSGAVHIMGSPVSFRKVYSPYNSKWYVDQSAAVYGAAVSDALGILFAPTFAQYASRHPGVDTWRLARRRVVAMHAALVGLEDPPTGMPAMVGTIIDQHLPLILHRPKCTSVFSVYRSNLAPESATKYECDFAETEKIVADLWGRADDHGSFKRLLMKGGPFPTSVRYVSAQLERTALHASTADAVTRLLRLSMLGAYPHSKVIAPPRVRKTVHTLEGIDLLKYFATGGPSRTSYHYFYLVAEFVMAATRRSPQLWHWVLSHARYVEYERLVSAAGDMVRRGERPPRIPGALAPRTWDLGASTVGFVAAAGGRRKLTPAMQRDYTPQRIRHVFESTLLSGRWGFSGDLMLLDPTSPRLKAVIDAETEFEQRQAVQKLNKIEAIGAQVVAHAVSAKAAVSINAVTGAVTKKQEKACQRRTGYKTHTVLVCIACATWRSKASVAGISRGSVGVRVLLPLGRGIVCNACQNTIGIRYVNLVGSILRIRPRADLAPVYISICTGCGAPASGMVRRGTEWLCTKCIKEYEPKSCHRPGCFVCGSTSILFSFMARLNGRMVNAKACGNHRPKMSGIVNAELEAVARMVSNRRPRYIRT